MIPDERIYNPLERQIIELQTKLAFQEDTVQALNDIVSEQQQDILALKGQVSLLLEELRSVLLSLDTSGISVQQETPPHY
jgi:SlyX protein